MIRNTHWTSTSVSCFLSFTPSDVISSDISWHNRCSVAKSRQQQIKPVARARGPYYTIWGASSNRVTASRGNEQGSR